MLTVLDQVANKNHLQMIKAVIPYLEIHQQKAFSVIIKMMELQNIVEFYDHGSYCMNACSASSESPSMLDVLSDIRNYCEDGDLEMIDQCIQMLSTLELYSLFAQSQSTTPSDSDHFYEERNEI